jgi:outer membrane protein OmpA-like peptidoglycan-associated protein
MTESGTARLEVADRIARFRRLAAMQGTIPPEVEQFAAPRGSAPGVDQPVPVVRVVFDERVFFDFDGDAPRPEAMTVLEQIAESMKRDAPDAAITVLGHTDAVGTDAYNIDLSRRRAASVVRLLIQRGVSPHQLSTVAIGKSQPVAPNDTPSGRARNRRVEFLVSSSEQANLALIRDRPVIADNLRLSPAQPRSRPQITSAEILKPAPEETAFGSDILEPVGVLTLREPLPAVPAERPLAEPLAQASSARIVASKRTAPTRVEPARLSPARPLLPRPVERVQPAPLTDPTNY